MKLVYLSVLLPIVLGGAIQGQEKCAWGPPYWCSHVSHARECGATKHCLQTVWKYQLIKPTSTASCTYCELIVTTMKSVLAEKVTEDKIASLLANACAEFPDSDVRDMCKGIVTDYVPELLQMFDSDISTDMICATVGLCSGLEDRWSPYGVKANNDTYCTDCMKFFKDVQDMVTSNETLNELEQLLNQTVCSHLEGFGGICNDFLKQYLPIALQTLADQIDPDIVCRVFGFCGSTDEHVIKIKNIFSEPTLQGALQYRSSEKCGICKDLIQEFNTVMESDTFQEKLATELKNVICPAMGDYFDIQCDHLMDGYAQKVIKLLANKFKLDPEITCQIVSLCPSDKKVDIVQRVKSMLTSRTSKMLTGQESSEECDICKDVVNQVDELIKDKVNQDKVKYELENVVCPEFGTFEDECKQLVEEYLPMLFELLVNEMDPSTVCEAVGLCTVPSLPKEVQIKNIETAAMVGPGYVKQSTLCTLCEEVMEMVDTVIQENVTINTVEELVDKICMKLPTDQLKMQCKAFVKEYGQLVVDLLAKELDPKTICTEIKLCTKTAVAKPKQRDDARCQLCVLLVTEVKELLANVSAEDLVNDLKGVCGYLPGNLSATCMKYVTDYAELVINLLKTEEPKSLCDLATLCSASHVPYLTKPIPETLSKLKASEECKVCNTIIVMLKFFLENNDTKVEVKQALQAGCKLLPSAVAVPCQDLVQVYGDNLINLLISELNATKICTGIGACKAVKKPTSALSVVMSPYDTLPLVELPKSNAVTCELCEAGMSLLLSKIKENATEAEIEEEVKKFCDIIPQAYKAECDQLIQDYGSQIVEYIVKKLSAHTICVELGLCKQMSSISAVMSPYDTLPIVKPVSEKKEESESTGNTVECETCKEVVNYIEKALQSNETEEEIKEMLKKLCSNLPSTLTAQCTDFVEKYTQAVINFLVLDLSPEDICKKLQLCSAGVRKLAQPVHIKLLKDVKGLSKVTASPECILCEFVMKELDNILKENRSEVAIKAALDKVCSLLPDTIETECEEFVNTYSQVIISLLAQELDPQQICTAIRLCTTRTVLKSLPEKVKDTSKVKAGPLCVLCEFVINEIDNLLENNASEAEIEAAVEKVCSILPDTIRTECIAFVDKYGPTIIQLLVQEISPSTICTLLQVCSSQMQWGTFVKILPEKNKDGVECELCTGVVEQVRQYLKENGTKGEVETYLDALCDKLPDTVTVQCHDVVAQYVSAILDLIDKDLNPKEICQQLGLCNNTLVTQKKADSTLFFKPHRLVGQNKCTYGPAYWCANKDNAVQCGAMEHCMRHVWN